LIVFEQKPFEEILGYLVHDEKVFVLRCKGCAKANQAGGEADVTEMKKKLEGRGIDITGSTIRGLLCVKAKSILSELNKDLVNTSSILVMACGLGVQSLAEVTDKVVHPACNSMPDRESMERGKREHRCGTCGDCVLEFTGGICPLTACSKGLLNGPCGGTSNGKCEVSKEMDCGWMLIYDRMKKLDRLGVLKSFLESKDYRKMQGPRRLIT